MIESTKAFKTSDGKTHASLEDAKAHELELLLVGEPSKLTGDVPSDVAATILENAERIVDILTTTATSKPRARKINGGSKPRKTKTPPTPTTPPA